MTKTKMCRGCKELISVEYPCEKCFGGKEELEKKYTEHDFDKVYNYLFMLQKEDGKIEADVVTFKKEMTEEEFKEVFEETQKNLGIVKGYEVVYLGFAYYQKKKDVIFSYGEIKVEKGEENDRQQEDTIQEPVK